MNYYRKKDVKDILKAKGFKDVTDRDVGIICEYYLSSPNVLFKRLSNESFRIYKDMELEDIGKIIFQELEEEPATLFNLYKARWSNKIYNFQLYLDWATHFVVIENLVLIWERTD